MYKFKCPKNKNLEKLKVMDKNKFKCKKFKITQEVYQKIDKLFSIRKQSNKITLV